jgi:small-conductance mechanosensitive channel
MEKHLQLIIPAVSILLGLIAGLAFEKIVLKRLENWATKAKIPGNKRIFKSIRGEPRLLCLIAGLYWAIISLDVSNLLPPETSDIIQRILTAIALYLVTLILSRLAAEFISSLTRRVEGVSVSLLSNLGKIVVLVLGILVILDRLGIPITPVLATLGIGGLAVALAFQETLANLFSGLYLVISKQVRDGDYIKIESGQEGYVIDITWRNTVIREISNNVVVVPNTKLASAIYTNYHLPVKEINLPIQVGVSYDSDLDRVEKVTLEVAKEVMTEISPNTANFEPFLFYEEFGEAGINFNVYLRVSEFLDQRVAKHEFIKRLHRRYQREEIEIPIPGIEVVYTNRQ